MPYRQHRCYTCFVLGKLLLFSLVCFNVFLPLPISSSFAASFEIDGKSNSSAGNDAASNTPKAGANALKRKARAYQEDAPLPVLIPPIDEDGGVLVPYGGTTADERNYELRNKAKAYQQNLDKNGINGNATDKAGGDLNSRARTYIDNNPGNANSIDLSVVGKDGVPIIPCATTQNVAGRIGDGEISGSLVYIVNKGKQVLVRCR